MEFKFWDFKLPLGLVEDFYFEGMDVGFKLHF